MMPALPMMMQPITPEKAQAMKDLESLKGLFKIHTPDHLTCPKCQKYGPTVCTKQDSKLQWYSCLAINTVLGPTFFCLIPFCVKDMKETLHHCSACNALIGKGHACNIGTNI